MSRLLIAAVVLGSLLGCGENKHDIYMRGLEIEGAAERGPCKLHYAQGEHAARLDRSQLTTCLVETQRAIAEYEKAKTLGYADAGFKKVYDRAYERETRLEDMIEMVGEMERDARTANLPGGR
ncbi:MAG: hypothetical protein KUG77_30425 [Nannocystaceae bacterium]|nr:hypothetical protein [Nannocystaceae bacterium]